MWQLSNVKNLLDGWFICISIINNGLWHYDNRKPMGFARKIIYRWDGCCSTSMQTFTLGQSPRYLMIFGSTTPSNHQLTGPLSLPAAGCSGGIGIQRPETKQKQPPMRNSSPKATHFGMWCHSDWIKIINQDGLTTPPTHMFNSKQQYLNFPVSWIQQISTPQWPNDPITCQKWGGVKHPHVANEMS